MSLLRCRLFVTDASATELAIEYYSTTRETTPFKVRRNILVERTIQRLNRWVRDKEAHCEREDLELLGEYLFEFLISGDPLLRKQFDGDFCRLFDSDGKLIPDTRFQIHLVFAPNLKDLPGYPWEFLCVNVNNERIFLAGQRSEMLLSRFVPNAETKAQALKTERDKLRVLVISCAPQNEAAGGDIPKVEVAGTLHVLQELENRGRIELRHEPNVDFEALKNILAGLSRDGVGVEHPLEIDVLHFIGHGAEGCLLLMKSKDEQYKERLETGDPGFQPMPLKECSAKSFAGLLPRPRPRLVFLQACEGAADSVYGLRSVASTFVYEHDVPAVVAMQYEISNEQAEVFATSFYRELADGCDIDVAVRAGRESLGKMEFGSRKIWGHRGFATPVAFLWSEKAIVGPARSQRKDDSRVDRETDSTEKLLGKVECPNPSCEDKIRLKDVRCTVCKVWLMPCPVCGHPMVKVQNPTCGACGYSQDERASAAVESVEAVHPPQASARVWTPVNDPRLS
jgi:hypothetical protein